MISLEQIVALALQQPAAMDQLGEALSSDLVLANPHQRRLAEFANGFLLQRRKLPAPGDWQMWLETLSEGMLRDGAREALGRLLALDVSGFDPQYVGSEAVQLLQRGAAQVARARLNALPEVEPEVLTRLATQVAGVRASGIQGLARLRDVETWSRPQREEALVSTGYPLLDELIGGWGQELWIAFADTGMGKSMLLQNFAVNVALRGKRVLHITLELGVGPQIRRYYRQIAQAPRGEFVHNRDAVVQRLQHWFRLTAGEVLLLEFPAYGLTPTDVGRTVERLNRTVGDVDVVVLDYLDLLALPTGVRGRGAYEDLGRLTHEVRGLCGVYNLTVLTASQAVRRPERAGRLTVRDMGDSYNKVRGADGLLSLCQTDEEEELHQGRLGVLKVRDSGGRGREINLYINRDLALIQELAHPNTMELMKRLGHLPPGVAPAAPAPGPRLVP